MRRRELSPSRSTTPSTSTTSAGPWPESDVLLDFAGADVDGDEVHLRAPVLLDLGEGLCAAVAGAAPDEEEQHAGPRTGHRDRPPCRVPAVEAPAVAVVPRFPLSAAGGDAACLFAGDNAEYNTKAIPTSATAASATEARRRRERGAGGRPVGAGARGMGQDSRLWWEGLSFRSDWPRLGGGSTSGLGLRWCDAARTTTVWPGRRRRRRRSPGGCPKPNRPRRVPGGDQQRSPAAQRGEQQETGGNERGASALRNRAGLHGCPRVVRCSGR